MNCKTSRRGLTFSPDRRILKVEENLIEKERKNAGSPAEMIERDGKYVY